MSNGLIYKVETTDDVAVTGTAASFSAAPARVYAARIASDRAIHVSFDGTAATVTDMFIPAGCVEVVIVSVGDALSVIKATGETDGTVWVTYIRPA